MNLIRSNCIFCIWLAWTDRIQAKEPYISFYMIDLSIIVFLPIFIGFIHFISLLLLISNAIPINFIYFKLLTKKVIAYNFIIIDYHLIISSSFSFSSSRPWTDYSAATCSRTYALEARSSSTHCQAGTVLAIMLWCSLQSCFLSAFTLFSSLHPADSVAPLTYCEPWWSLKSLSFSPSIGTLKVLFSVLRTLKGSKVWKTLTWDFGFCPFW